MGKSKIQDFCVIDCETGGFFGKDKKTGKINEPVLDVALTEVAMVYVSPELEILGKDSFLVKPYEAIYTPRALTITNLSKEKLEKEGIPLEDAVPRINDFIYSYQTQNTKPVLVGHNMKGFDIDQLEVLYLMHGDNVYKHFSKTILDTLELSYLAYIEAPDFKLGTMISQFDISLENAHRALDDTVATAEMFIAYIRNLRGEGQSDASAPRIDVIRDKVDNYKF